MNRTKIYLLAVLITTVLIMAAFPYAGGFQEEKSRNNAIEHETIEHETVYTKFCTETRNAAIQYNNSEFTGNSEFSIKNEPTKTENQLRIGQVRNSPGGIKFPASPDGNQNMPQNVPQNSRSDDNRSDDNRSEDSGSVQHPFFERGSPADMELLGRDELNNFLKNQSQDWNFQENGSYYQSYVTPDDEVVSSYLEENGLDNKYEIYKAALSWAWVSDETLNGMEEKWLTPAEFLEETPNYSENPVSGEPASDCEEQANTLASLLIASGEYNESSVRVAIGEVNFGDVSGGHAWVEVYEDGAWFPLDTTGGPYYDDDSSKLIEVDTSKIDYEEYKDSTYPAVEIWYYYNNEYFIDMETQSGDAPVSWQKTPASYEKSMQAQRSYTRSYTPSNPLENQF